MSIRPPKRGQLVKNCEIGSEKTLKYPSFQNFQHFSINPCFLGKYLCNYHLDLWGISANVNSIFGLFTTHSLTNSIEIIITIKKIYTQGRNHEIF